MIKKILQYVKLGFIGLMDKFTTGYNRTIIGVMLLLFTFMMKLPRFMNNVPAMDYLILQLILGVALFFYLLLFLISLFWR